MQQPLTELRSNPNEGLKILFLGPETSPVFAYLAKTERQVISLMERFDTHFLQTSTPDFAVSHGYRHVIKPPILDYLKDRIVNLHISYLPWNRGADPNFWSFVEDTPKGITIHYMDHGIDTGDIIVQRRMEFDEYETLASAYQKLQKAICNLFFEHWPSIRGGTCQRKPQCGTFHKTGDKEKLAFLLKDGWDTPVSVLTSYAAETQMSQQFWDTYESEISNRYQTGFPPECGALVR